MIYVEGFVTAVPAANKEAYLNHAAKAAPLLKECGVRRMVESWGNEVPEGKVTDFRRAVQAKEGEVVVFSWFEYPSRQVRDVANGRITEDPRMKAMASSMPFDGQRMIFSGFEGILEEGGQGKTGYVDGYVVPVPTAGKEGYLQFARKHAPIFREYGAIRIVETWGDDVSTGKVTDFRKAVQATADESVVYAWVEWSSKAERDSGWQKIMADQRMKPDPASAPFDGKRMIYGGFSPILDI